MAINKRALIRYKVLDNCFSRKYKQFYIEDLMEECGKVLSEHFGSEITISRRTIYGDMNFMKSEAGYSAPIESIRNGKRTYYQYSEPDFSIQKSPLNPEELEQLRNAIEIFGRVKGLQKFEWMNELETKLDDFITEKPNEIISFEENEYLKGIDFLNPLYNYIKNQTVLKINYQSFNVDEAQEVILHPYYLKQYNNRWFLFGWNEEFESIQNLALDRIQDIEMSSIEFIANEYDFDEYFEDIIGVTVPKEAVEEEIVLSFAEGRLPYVVSKPIHGSQRIINGKIHLNLKVNKELISHLLSFGSDLQIIAPETLKKQMIKEIDEMRNNY